MKLTDEQKKIEDTFLNTDKNIVINAVAGSGKTSTILNLLKHVKKNSIFIAFNKSIEIELNKKIEDLNLTHKAKAMTLHSLGLKTILYQKKKQISVKNGKKFYLLNKYDKKYFNPLSILIDKARLFFNFNLDFLSKFIEIPITDDFKEIWESFKKEWFDNYKDNKVYIDFIDMIFVPVFFKMKIPFSPEILFIDEAQDLNYINHLLINMISYKKFVAVGDVKQSIYGFSGAYPESFNLFLEKKNTILLPLTTCFRCSRNIINEANKVFNIMKYGNKEEGLVSTLDDISKIKDNSLIVCRNNSNLLFLYFELLKLKKNVSFKDINSLNEIINFLKYKKSISKTLKEIQEKNKIKEIDIERLNILKLFQNIYKTDEIEKILNQLIKIKNKKGNILLSSIHKAKGLERDYVYILDINLIPSPFAKTKEDFTQEENLKYVAITRAKKSLYYINTKNILNYERRKN